jgi:nucleotide-binding universal stress UspA family protein
MSARYDKVLVAIDGSESSGRILEHTRILAAIHESEVVVLHVRQLAYSGASTLDVGGPLEVSAEDAAADLREAGISARSLEEDAYLGEDRGFHRGGRTPRAGKSYRHRHPWQR